MENKNLNNIESKKINIKEIITDSISGISLGLNSGVYGSSSSLFLYQTKEYETVLENLYNLFTPKSFKEFGKNLLCILPLLLSFIISFIVIFAISSALHFAGYQLILVFTFIGINIVGLLLTLFLKRNRPTILINSFKKKDTENRNLNLIIFFVLIPLIIGISFIARFAWSSSFPYGHINLNQMVEINNSYLTNTNSIMSSNNISTNYAIQIVFASFLCGLVFLIPGLSGSFMMAVIGSDSYILNAVYYAFGGFSIDSNLVISSNWAWATIFIAFIGLVIGFISSIFLARYLIKKDKQIFNTMVFGFALSQFISIFISLPNIDYLVIDNNSLLLGLSITFLLLSIIVGNIYFVLYGRKNNISFSWIWNNEIEYY